MFRDQNLTKKRKCLNLIIHICTIYIKIHLKYKDVIMILTDYSDNY